MEGWGVRERGEGNSKTPGLEFTVDCLSSGACLREPANYPPAPSSQNLLQSKRKWIQGRTSIETEVKLRAERDEIAGSPDFTSLRTHSWRRLLVRRARASENGKNTGVIFSLRIKTKVRIVDAKANQETLKFETWNSNVEIWNLKLKFENSNLKCDIWISNIDIWKLKFETWKINFGI